MKPGAGRGGRVPELLPGPVGARSAARSEAGWNALSWWSNHQSKRGRRGVAEVDAGVHVGVEGVGGERVARPGAGAGRARWRRGASPSRSCEEAPEERGGGAAVEAVRVVEDLELHRAGQSSDRPSIPSTRETGRGTSRGPPPGRPRGARAGRGRTGAAGERRYTDRAGPATPRGERGERPSARPPAPRVGASLRQGVPRGSGQPFPRVRLARDGRHPGRGTPRRQEVRPPAHPRGGQAGALAPDQLGPHPEARAWRWPASPSTCTASGSRSSATPR